MASDKDGEILTQVGPGTPMGELMRQYWLPAALSSELKPDGEPLRLLLLGERLIAFRDSSGRIGIFDHRCPHRCASLFFGRNEADGLRCVYHGWKFDVAGTCVDMPNVPPASDYKHKVRAKAYTAVERNGLVWVYMGPRAQPPALPMLEPTLLPENEVELGFMQRECNWLQALEGDIDTTHTSFLHFGMVDPNKLATKGTVYQITANRTASLKVNRTDWGLAYYAAREVDGAPYWRFAHFLFPFWTYIPNGQFSHHVLARAWVPMDDTHTMAVILWWKGAPRQDVRTSDGRFIPGAGGRAEFLPNTTDWCGRWRSGANAGNDYRINREVQRTLSFTGIDGINLQDQAITESMGPITDHRWEHLGPSDVMIIQTRRLLLSAARALSTGGEIPPGVDNPASYLGARGGDFVTTQWLDWKDAYTGKLREAADPTGMLHRAPRLDLPSVRA